MSYLNGLRDLANVSNHAALLNEAQEYYSETSDIGALPLIALAFYKLKQSADGDSAIDEIIPVIDELPIESRLDLISAYMAKGDIASAKLLLQENYDKNPDNPRLLSSLAKCHWLEGKFEHAIECQSIVIRLTPENLFERDVLISALLFLNNFERAQVLINESICIYEKQASTLSEEVEKQLVSRLRIHQVKIWVGTERIETVDEWLQGRHDSLEQKEWTELAILAGELFYTRGHYLEATVILENAFRSSPDNFEIASTIATLAEGRGDHPKAIQYLTLANKALTKSDDRRLCVLVKLTKLLIDHNPSIARSYLEQTEDVLREIEMFTEDNVDFKLREQSEVNKACLAAVEGKNDQAEEIFKMVLAINPNSEIALAKYGNFKIEIGQVKESVAIFEKLKTINFNAGINALFLAKQFPEDEKTLLALERDCRVLIDKKGVGTETLLHLASAWEKINNYDKAFALAIEANGSIARGLSYDPQIHRDHCARIRTSFTKELYDNRREIGSGSELPVFVVGMPRSGTTLVEQVLASHTLIFGAGETDVIAKRVKGLDVWEKRIGSGRCYPDCVDDISAADAERLTSDILKDYTGLKCEQKPKARYVIDKLPHNFESIGLIKLLFPNAKIISVRRDPRDIAISNFFIDFNAKYSGMGFAYDLEWIGEQLADHNQLMNHWNDLFPDQIHEITYEELVEDFEGVSRKMFEYIGVGWESNALEYNKLNRKVKTASVWQVRQPVYKTSKAKWVRYRKYLKPLIAGTNAPIIPNPITDKITLPDPGLYLDGNKRYKEGDLDGAELNYKKMLHHNPEHASCNYMVGLIYCKKGRPDLAIPLLEKATTYFPENIDWANALSKAKEITSTLLK